MIKTLSTYTVSASDILYLWDVRNVLLLIRQCEKADSVKRRQCSQAKDTEWIVLLIKADRLGHTGEKDLDAPVSLLGALFCSMKQQSEKR